MIIKSNITSIADFEAWSGGEDTKDAIIENNKVKDFDIMIEEIYPDGITETDLNGLLWHDSEWVFERLEIEQ